MGAAAIVVGVSLVIILVTSAAVTQVWRKRALRRRDETPEDQYRRTLETFDGRTTAAPDEPKVWPSQGTGGGM